MTLVFGNTGYKVYADADIRGVPWTWGVKRQWHGVIEKVDVQRFRTPNLRNLRK